jgi:MFS family permease
MAMEQNREAVSPPDGETKKTVRTFAFASFFNDMGSDMIYPIWPLFVASLGANMAVLGFIDGIGNAIVSISQALSGYISDRTRKRKVFIWLGYLFGGLSRLGYALSTSWHWLVPFRILDRAGKMRGAPRDAMVADLSKRSNRGENFGLIRTLDNAGALVGIVFCIAFFPVLGYQNLLLIAAVPSLIAMALIVSGIREQRLDDAKIFKGVSFSHLDRNFRMFVALSAIFSIGAFSYSFLLIFANKFGFRITTVPFLYLLFTLVATFCSYPLGVLSDRIGRKAVLQISYALWGLVCLVMIFADSSWMVIAAFVLFGLHQAGIETVQKAFVAELGPAEYRASTLGGFQMVIGLCALPASVIAGLLWDRFGMEAPFIFSLLLTTLSAGMLFFVRERAGG